MKKYFAEFIGTFVLVLFGTAAAVLTGDVIVTSLTFGLAIVACAYGIGSISGCHVNPAVSLAMLIQGRLSFKDLCGYILAQVAGAFAGSGLLYFLITNTVIEKVTSLGANGFGEQSVANLTLTGAIVLELVLTFIFVLTVVNVTKEESKANVAPIAIGLSLTLVHFIGFYLTGTSVNPARSLAPAVILGGEALKQVWVFIVCPFAGAALASVVTLLLNMKPKKAVEKKVDAKKVSKKSK